MRYEPKEIEEKGRGREKGRKRKWEEGRDKGREGGR